MGWCSHIKEMNGFLIGDKGYGFTEDGLYVYVRDDDTMNMDGLYKTRNEAILAEIKDTEEYILELKRMLNNE